jgi:2-dehydropantoate 2-reductase
MDGIRNIAILGAGALGCMYGAMFAAAGLHNVRFVARGERAARLARDGVVVNGRPYSIPVAEPVTEKDGFVADLVIVAVKHHHLKEALQELVPVVGGETLFVSVMNGLESEGIIAEELGTQGVLQCVALGMDAVREGNAVTYSTPGVLYVGEQENAELTDRVRRVQRALTTAAIPHHTPVDMRRIMWWKLMINVGMNQSSAVLGRPYGLFQRDTEAQGIMNDLMAEVVAVAAAAGVNLTEHDIADWYNVLATLSPDGKTSMLQDIEAGRKTEVEVFAGSVVELGEQHGVPTPINRTFLHLIRVLEGSG